MNELLMHYWFSSSSSFAARFSNRLSVYVVLYFIAVSQFFLSLSFADNRSWRAHQNITQVFWTGNETKSVSLNYEDEDFIIMDSPNPAVTQMQPRRYSIFPVAFNSTLICLIPISALHKRRFVHYCVASTLQLSSLNCLYGYFFLDTSSWTTQSNLILKIILKILKTFLEFHTIP